MARALGADVSRSPGAPINLLLIRHARHADVGLRLTGRAGGAGLTPEGEREAAALGAALVAEGLAAVHCSPRERARATAEAVAGAVGLEVAIADALDEVDFGGWTGARFADLDGRPDWDRWNAARADARPPGGEGMAEAVDRIAAHADAVAAQPPAGPVAFVTHCDLIRGLVARVLGMPLGNLLRMDCEPASVTRLAWPPGGPARLLTLNETPLRRNAA